MFRLVYWLNKQCDVVKTNTTSNVQLVTEKKHLLCLNEEFNIRKMHISFFVTV